MYIFFRENPTLCILAAAEWQGKPTVARRASEVSIKKKENPRLSGKQQRTGCGRFAPCTWRRRGEGLRRMGRIARPVLRTTVEQHGGLARPLPPPPRRRDGVSGATAQDTSPRVQTLTAAGRAERPLICRFPWVPGQERFRFVFLT